MPNENTVDTSQYEEITVVRDGDYFIVVVDGVGGKRLTFGQLSENLQRELVNSGIAGAQGDPGQDGDDGLDGATGAAGPQGQKGVAGGVGATGPAGAASSVAGPTGPTGATGPAGNPGAQGQQGNPGVDSTVAGPTGPAGGKGEPGDVTAQGNKGEPGAQGQQGNPGLDGAAGLDSTVAGPQGLPGGRGADGEKGSTGAPSTVAGPVGASGAPGAMGNPGLDGAAGAASTVAGPVGAKGGTGQKGVAGAKGSDGQRGATGSQGPAGIQGLTGRDGTDGRDGALGPVGPTGADSMVAGPTGPDGGKGEPGDVTAQGNKGEPGADGRDGSDGMDGGTGPAGIPGIPGVDGSDSTVPGPPGAIGPDGPQGDQGTQGQQGPPLVRENIYAFQPNVESTDDETDSLSAGIVVRYVWTTADINTARLVAIEIFDSNTQDAGKLDRLGNYLRNVRFTFYIGAQSSLSSYDFSVSDYTVSTVQVAGVDQTRLRIPVSGLSSITEYNANSPSISVGLNPGDYLGFWQGQTFYSTTNTLIEFNKPAGASRGTTGTTGVKGDIGDMGPDGARGTQGIQGDPGHRGPQGIQGNTGASGRDGSDGSMGDTGPKGRMGQQGVKGNTGGVLASKTLNNVLVRALPQGVTDPSETVVALFGVDNPLTSRTIDSFYIPRSFDQDYLDAVEPGHIIYIDDTDPLGDRILRWYNITAVTTLNLSGPNETVSYRKIDTDLIDSEGTLPDDYYSQTSSARALIVLNASPSGSSGTGGGGKGDKGDPGPGGGAKGEPGATGPTGADSTVPGPAGGDGLDGQKGQQGQRGQQGDPGNAGAQGAQGDPGHTGSQGDPGQKGQRGEQGDQGNDGDDSTVPGPQGPTGADGPEGQRGNKGQKGVSGQDGTGSKGSMGDPGVDSTVPGPMGDPGEKGSPGDIQAQGAKGDPGQKGSDGETGTRGPQGDPPNKQSTISALFNTHRVGTLGEGTVTGITYDPTIDKYWTLYRSTPKVRKYDIDVIGETITADGAAEALPSGITSPNAIAYYPDDGNVYIADRVSGTETNLFALNRIDPNAVPVLIPVPYGILGMTHFNDLLYCFDSPSNRIVTVDPRDGSHAVVGDVPGDVSTIHGLAVLDGDLYAGDFTGFADYLWRLDLTDPTNTVEPYGRVGAFVSSIAQIAGMEARLGALIVVDGNGGGVWRVNPYDPSNALNVRGPKGEMGDGGQDGDDGDDGQRGSSGAKGAKGEAGDGNVDHVITRYEALPDSSTVPKTSIAGETGGSGADETVDTVWFRKKSAQTFVTVRMDLISSRNRFSVYNATGWANRTHGSVWGTGGAIHPSRPAGLQGIVRTWNGSHWQWWVDEDTLFEDSILSIKLRARMEGTDAWYDAITLTRTSGSDPFRSPEYVLNESPFPINVHQSWDFQLLDATDDSQIGLLPGPDHLSQIIDTQELQRAAGEVLNYNAETNIRGNYAETRTSLPALSNDILGSQWYIQSEHREVVAAREYHVATGAMGTFSAISGGPSVVNMEPDASDYNDGDFVYFNFNPGRGEGYQFYVRYTANNLSEFRAISPVVALASVRSNTSNQVEFIGLAGSDADALRLAGVTTSLVINTDYFYVNGAGVIEILDSTTFVPSSAAGEHIYWAALGGPITEILIDESASTGRTISVNSTSFDSDASYNLGRALTPDDDAKELWLGGSYTESINGTVQTKRISHSWLGWDFRNLVSDTDDDSANSLVFYIARRGGVGLSGWSEEKVVVKRVRLGSGNDVLKIGFGSNAGTYVCNFRFVLRG